MSENDSNVKSGASRRLSVLAGQVLGINKCSNAERKDVASTNIGKHTSVQLLQGKVAIITGSGMGIGAATAKLFASHGAKVVISDLNEGAAERVAKKIREAGGEVVVACGDITADEVPQKIVAAAVSAFGDNIDILVNNAGYTWDAVIQKTSPQHWKAMMEVHLDAPFRLMQAAEPYMRGSGKKEREAGKEPRARFIVNISSTSGTHGNAGQANYAAAKAGLLGLTKTAAKEWGPFGVRCNVVAFGLIDTRLTRPREQGEKILTKEGQAISLGIPASNSYWKTVKEQIPLQRVGRVEEAAGAIFLLVQSYASYITGQVVEANGGAFM